MIYLSLGLNGLLIWFGPWWFVSLGALICGVLIGERSRRLTWRYGLGAAIAAFALTFLRDGQSYGLIAPRLAGLFQLPSPYLVFLLCGLINAISAFLMFRAGQVLAPTGRFLTTVKDRPAGDSA